jgi:phosphonate transport system substrate-binding protein
MGIVCVVPPALGAAKASARAELLAAALRRDLGVEVSAVVAANYGELERQLNDATVDVAWCPAAVCARLTRAAAAFSVVREGVSSYRSALIARREDKLNVLQLDGKRAAWVDPLSAGGHLLAVALLKSRGLSCERVFASQAFLGTHRAVALAVLQNDADVGAVSIHGVHDNALEAMMRWYVGPNGDRLETIAVSERCPNDALVISERLPIALTAQLTEILSKAHEGPKGSQVLAALECERFEPADLGSYKRAFASVGSSSKAPPPMRP